MLFCGLIFYKLCEMFTLKYFLLENINEIPIYSYKTIAKKILQICVTPATNFSTVALYRRIKNLICFVNYFLSSSSSADSCDRNLIHHSETKY